MSFSSYDIEKHRYQRLVASYLQTEGTQFQNNIRLKYDLVNQYKDRIVEFWRLFDIDYLEQQYIQWKQSTRSGVPGAYVFTDDSEWIHTEFVERICSSYQITRDYFSYYANAIPPGGTGPLEAGSIRLNNLNMLRMLKIRRSMVGFDGSREYLEEALRVSLNNNYLAGQTDAPEIFFTIQTSTGLNQHLTLSVKIIRPAIAEGNILWTKEDDYLVYDGEYFIKLLGIETSFEPVDSDTLVYDISNYDEAKYK